MTTDWRCPAPPAGPAPARAAPVKPVRPTLHRRARPTTLAGECARAAEITLHAKSAIESAFSDITLGRPVATGTLAPIVASIAASIARNPIAIPSVTRLKNRHEYTYLHSVAVCGLMIGLARALRLPERDMHDIGMAGLLHDIGKAQIPKQLLDKPGALTDTEFAVVRSHTQRGLELLDRSGGVPDIALDVCAHHHERIDGAGYPFGLGGGALSVYARMGAICDVYDAVTSARSYKNAWLQSEALDWMASTRGQFDPAIFEAFRNMIAVFPIGALVRLQSDRLGAVLDEAGGDPLSPPVAVFFCTASGRAIERRRVDTAADPIVALERPDAWHIADWRTLRAELLTLT